METIESYYPGGVTVTQEVLRTWSESGTKYREVRSVDVKFSRPVPTPTRDAWARSLGKTITEVFVPRTRYEGARWVPVKK